MPPAVEVERSKPEDLLARRFAEVPPLTTDEGLFEASRCLYCFDAPCTRACPTAIDVPRFIRQILHRDESSAGRTILEANIFGGSCARACPTEVLCEGACVDRVLSGGPIPIGRLQRLACDAAVDRGLNFFQPGPATGKRVAIIGSGPAGLTCAHELRKLGHEVVVFEARGHPGGLDTQGVAAYKVSTDFALREIERICSIGIEIKLNHEVSPADLPTLRQQFDAVFLGIGLGRTSTLGIEGESREGVWEALDFIAQTRLRPFKDCKVGRNVVVLGAGNTAIDAASAACRLGANRVTIVYRRAEASMSAYPFEVDMARRLGVRFEWSATPLRIVGDDDGQVRGVEFLRTSAAPAQPPSSPFLLDCDMVIKALGQGPLVDWLAGFDQDNGRIVADLSSGSTSVRGVFAGGDCLRRGGEVVDAVQDGKLASRGIDAYLR